MTKRYFLHKHLGRDVIHDILCHNWLKGEELEEHMNVQYTKYSALKKEKEQIKNVIREAYETERTDLGKMTLKNLLLNLGVDDI